MHRLRNSCDLLQLRRCLRTRTKRTLHSSTASNSPAVQPSPVKVDIIAHRGASGRMPDHTLETYKAAFETGADWIELDAHSTLDGELVVNHDIELAETTDIEDWAWADTYRTRTIAPCFDGESHVMEGYMVSDFTLEQLKKLRVKMRHVERSQEYNLQFQIPTVLETCNLLQSMIDDIKTNQSHEWKKAEWLAEFFAENGMRVVCVCLFIIILVAGAACPAGAC